mmetsp:Transcript_52313/g.156093  ORF Transcript_52313/g.156093 Transcript_52313/m.156093 type:complete len:253 (+) Transcript_52313:64-822(+)
MANLGSPSMEENPGLPEVESQPLLLDVEGAALSLGSSPRVQLVRRRFAVAGVAGLALLGAALMVVLPRLAGPHVLVQVGAQGVEQKFYDGNGAYWQAPGKGISTSELWESCENHNMHVCGGYCCCDKDYYWNSPKTIYKQGKTILKTSAEGAAEEQSHGLSATAAGEAAKKAAEALGRAVVRSVVSKEQECVPQAQVPQEVVQALADGSVIQGSNQWMACSTFTSNTHTCGSYCCCNGGLQWSASEEACVPK